MGVMPCDRGNCRNILCDRLILERSRYICADCWAELLAWRERWPESDLTEPEVRERIEQFMRTDVGACTPRAECSTEETFRRLTE